MAALWRGMAVMVVDQLCAADGRWPSTWTTPCSTRRASAPGGARAGVSRKAVPSERDERYALITVSIELVIASYRTAVIRYAAWLLCGVLLVGCTEGAPASVPSAPVDRPPAELGEQDEQQVESTLPTIQRIGLHVSDQELRRWRDRAADGPYRIEGDVSSGSPGDWDRIVDSAKEFRDNPDGARWDGPDAGEDGCVPQWAEEPPTAEAAGLRDAAFIYLLTGDSEYGDLVKQELLIQSEQDGLDFSDEDLWCSRVILDVNPGFNIAQWLTTLLYAYDYLGPDFFEDAQRRQLDKWFVAGADWLLRDLDHSLSNLFEDRSAGDYSLESIDPMYGDSIAYLEGPRIGTVARHYNNRRAAQIRLVALSGVKFDVRHHLEAAKRFVKEYLAFSVYPEGAGGDYHRWRSDRPAAGWSYQANALGSMITIADAFARVGDSELYEYVADCGLHGTEGGEKSLLSSALDQYRYIDGTFERYAARSVSDVRDESRISGYGVHDIWVAQANVYYKSQELRERYLRTGDDMPPYPVSPPTNGPFDPWTGEGGTYPGVMFMFGDLEQSPSPYPQEPLIQVVQVADPCDGTAVRSEAPPA